MRHVRRARLSFMPFDRRWTVFLYSDVHLTSNKYIRKYYFNCFTNICVFAFTKYIKTFYTDEFLESEILQNFSSLYLIHKFDIWYSKKKKKFKVNASTLFDNEWPESNIQIHIGTTSTKKSEKLTLYLLSNLILKLIARQYKQDYLYVPYD